MLFDFHQYQNDLRKDSIHATYLVCGLAAAKNEASNGTEMDMSPLHPEDLPQAFDNKKLTLVGEENLPGLLVSHMTTIQIGPQF
jgi:hypothetical protein